MSARYTLPVFNLGVNIWRNGRLYTDPPDVITVGNLALGRRVSGSKLQSNTTNPSDGGMWLLLPKSTDIRDSKAVTGEDMVEVPAGSGRLYTSKWVDDCGKGFSNEHRFSVIFGLPPWGVPFPGPPMPPPPPPSPLPYSRAQDWPAVTDSVTFTPTGKLVTVVVFIANPTNTTPTLFSSIDGGVIPLAGQQGLTTATPTTAGVFMYQYQPIGPSETLTLSCGDPDSCFSWTVRDSGGSGNDDEGQLLIPAATSFMKNVLTSSPTGDFVWFAELQIDLAGLPAISSPLASDPTLDGITMFDSGGNIWRMSLLFASAIFPPFATVAYSGIGGFDIIYVYQSVQQP